MQTALAALSLAAFLLIAPAIGSAQGSNDPPQPDPLATLLERNPLLERVQEVEPNALESLLRQLGSLSASTRQGRVRSAAKPSAQEMEEIEANPAFASANRRAPGQTLQLLRGVNTLMSARRKNDLGR